jgi:hypothetical protein
MHDSKMTRRKVIGGIGAGLALAATPVPRSKATASPGLVDPTTKFPRPPFSSQSQPWPGLAGKMTPRPDHGETRPR